MKQESDTTIESTKQRVALEIPTIYAVLYSSSEKNK